MNHIKSKSRIQEVGNEIGPEQNGAARIKDIGFKRESFVGQFPIERKVVYKSVFRKFVINRKLVLRDADPEFVKGIQDVTEIPVARNLIVSEYMRLLKFEQVFHPVCIDRVSKPAEF